MPLFESVLTVGSDDVGHDVKFFGATSGRYMLWDESADSLHLRDNVKLKVGSNTDMQFYHQSSIDTNILELSKKLHIIQNQNDGDIQFSCDDGSGGIDTYLQIDGGEGYTLASKHIRFKDDAEARFGTGSDMAIYHDGSNSFMRNDTGHLTIANSADNSDIIFQSDDGSGGLTTYFYLDGGAAIGSGDTGLKSTIFPDGSLAGFGNESDLSLYHYSGNSAISNSTGNLTIANLADDKDVILQSDDGSGGVTAYLTLDGGDVKTYVHKDMKFNDSVAASFGNNDFQILHDGTNTRLYNYTGNMQFINYADDADIIFQSDDGSGGVTNYMALDGGLEGTVFYKKVFFVDNAPVQIGNSLDLQIYHDGSDSFITNATGDLTITQNTDDGKIIFQTDDESGGVETYMSINGTHGHTRFTKNTRHQDSVKAFFGSGDDLEIQHDGSHSYISQGGTGNLFIQQNTNDADLILQCDDGSNGTTAYLTLDGSASTIEVAKPTNFADDVTLTSAGSQQPLLTLKTTHTTKTASAELQFLKDAADTEDGENLGLITFYGEDEGNNNTKFAHIKGSIQESTNGQEGGSIKLAVATHDGEMVNGLVINDGDAEDEIDVTIGSTATSMTTVAGNLTVNGAIISVGGSNADLNMNAGSDIVLEADNAGGGNTSSIQYLDAAGTNRIVLGVDGDVVQLCNRAANGTVTVKANTSTAGGGGETLVTTFADTEATFAVPVVLEADSTVGWHGSVTRVKILPRDFQADTSGRPLLTTLGTNETTSTNGTATAIETEKAITNVDSTTTNFILIEVSSDGTADEVHGGYMTIAPI